MLIDNVQHTKDGQSMEDPRLAQDTPHVSWVCQPKKHHSTTVMAYGPKMLQDPLSICSGCTRLIGWWFAKREALEFAEIKILCTNCSRPVERLPVQGWAEWFRAQW